MTMMMTLRNAISRRLAAIFRAKGNLNLGRLTFAPRFSHDGEMRSRKVNLLPWMGILLLPSCALLFPDRTAPKSSEYRVQAPPSPWHKLEVGTDPNAPDSMKADVAYENPDTGAIISLNSLCRKYSDASLESLTANLVRGIGKRELIDQQEITVNGAKALDSVYSGEVDKVPLRIRTVVLAKASCTYDFIYVAIPKRDKDGGRAFEAFLASFKTE
jgi:hypothetical protein